MEKILRCANEIEEEGINRFKRIIFMIWLDFSLYHGLEIYVAGNFTRI